MSRFAAFPSPRAQKGLKSTLDEEFDTDKPGPEPHYMPIAWYPESTYSVVPVTLCASSEWRPLAAEIHHGHDRSSAALLHQRLGGASARDERVRADVGREPEASRVHAVISRSHRLSRTIRANRSTDPLFNGRGSTSHVQLMVDVQTARFWADWDGTFMEQRGRNRWQRFASPNTGKRLDLALNRCHRLPPAAVWIAW
jgi:hypothetical protein